MSRARDRCLPMNFTADDLRSHSVARDRLRLGASLADIDPMGLDKSVKFDSVGGLVQQVNALKEIVIFPLLYPEVKDLVQHQAMFCCAICVTVLLDLQISVWP